MTKPSDLLIDATILEEMHTTLRRHLSAALLECSAISRDLQYLDPDNVMHDLRKYMDADNAPMQDLLSDAFHKARQGVGADGWDALACDLARDAQKYEQRKGLV